jgi:SAM-dependent methyltransferase
MAHDSVRQLQALSDLLGGLLRELKPRRLALPGCTTGNGLEHVDQTETELILAIDLNLDYLRLLRARFGRLPGLLTVCADLRRFSLPHASFDLVHAALLLEYLDPQATVTELASWLAPGAGLMSVVLQLPSSKSAPVSETPYRSLQRLAPLLRLVPPEELDRVARAASLVRVRATRLELPRDKGFWVGLYRRG